MTDTLAGPRAERPAGLSPVDFEIVIPVFKEGEGILKTYARLHDELDDCGLTWRVFFVYDFPEDPTVPYLERLRANDARVTPTLQNYGRGVVNALKYGFDVAHDGPVAVVMGDDSDDIARLPAMMRMIQEGAAVASASRHSKGGDYQGGEWLKKTMSRIAGKTLAAMGLGTQDPTNNYKGYSGAFVKSLQLESVAGFEIALEITVKAAALGLPIREVPAVWRDRVAGESNFKLWKWLPHYLKWFFFGLAMIRLPQLGRVNMREPQADTPPPRSRLALAGLAPLAITLAFIALIASPVFFWDEWDSVVGLLNGGFNAAAIWLPHNEHRVVLPKLLFFGMQRLHSDARFGMVASALLCWLTLWMLARALPLKPKPDGPAWLAPLITTLIAFFFFSWVQGENLFWGFQVCWFLEAFGAVGAILSGLKRQYGRMMLFSAIAYLSLAAWGALIPVLSLILLSDWLQTIEAKPRQTRKRVFFAFVVLSIAALWLYLPSEHAANPLELGWLADPLKLFSFAIMLLSVPFSPMGRHMAFVIGLILAVVLAVTYIRRPRTFSPPAFYLMLYALVVAIVIAHGRAGPWHIWGDVPYRYSTLMLPAWLGLFSLAVPRMRKTWIAALFAAALAINVVVVDSKAYDHEEGAARTRNEGIACLHRLLEKPEIDHASPDYACAMELYPNDHFFENARAYFGPKTADASSK